MEHIVVIRNKVLFIFLLFISSQTMAQQKIDNDLTFIGKKTIGKKNISCLVNLNRFLEVDSDVLSKEDKCMSAEGVFKFQINFEGKINSIEVLGDLPDTLVIAIKEKIELTNDFWVFNDSLKKQKVNKLFIYPVYVSRNLEQGCDATDPKSYVWLYKFFDKRKIIKGDESYLLRPDLYYAMY